MSAANSPVKQVKVSAPSRLHFGLLSIGNLTKRKFGGAGLMIESPRTVVSISPSDTFELTVPDESRQASAEAVQSWKSHFAPETMVDADLAALPLRMEVEPAPRHRGLGSGTQLAFAVATALQAAMDQPLPSTTELALSMDRGKRSAIGSYGFHQGGFLVDRGIVGEDLAPLEVRLDFPKAWKIVLIEPTSDGVGSVFGDKEQIAFRDLPPTIQEEADALAQVLADRVAPSMMSQDFKTFASAVTEYGYRSGLFYSPIQGGAYASPAATRIVDLVSECGTFAVGQSSWGPLIFAICESEDAAKCLVEYLGEHGEDVVCQVTVTSGDNEGVVVQAN